MKLVSTYDPQAYGPTPFSPRGFPRFLSIRGAWELQVFDLALLLTYPNSMVNLENNYAILERMIKPKRYIKDTCPRVYDT
jgi:hypothetical protein